MKYLYGIVFLAVMIFSSVAFAETPGHNPDYDFKCGDGFQWSVMTVACEQANCPPGARRNFTLECSCGEVWGEPFRTCYGAIGLASHCISSSQQCEDVEGGFDPLSGDCKFMEGFVWNDDKSGCIREYPEKMKCKIQDVFGNPVKDMDVSYGEYTTHMLNPDSSGKLKTDSSGFVEFDVTNRRANMIKFIFRKGGGFYQTTKEVRPEESNGECVLTVYSNEQIEKWIKDEYTDFLKDACLDKAALEKIKNAEIVFGSDVGSSQYDADENKLYVSSGDLGSDWDGLSRALMHEFGHFISDQIIDPTSVFVKGYPFFGKYVGGGHTNWDPNKTTDGWGPDVDPEQLAFEEAMVDFIAAQYFASKGLVYQDDINSTDKAMEVVAQHGRENASKTEGVIASFLIDYYRAQSEGGKKGPALAVGDFIRASTYDSRNGYTWLSVPARTIQEFLASKVKSDKNDPKDDCSAKSGEEVDLKAFVDKFGFGGTGKPKIKFNPKDAAQVELIKTSLNDINLFNPDGLAPLLDSRFEFPVGTAPIVELFPDNYLDTGEIQRVALDPESVNLFSVDANNVVNLEQGGAYAENTDVSTPNLTISHIETEYFVSVDEDGEESVEVMKGSVEVSEKAGEMRTVTVLEGEGTSFDEDDGFEVFEAGSQGGSGRTTFLFFALALIFGLVAMVFMYKKRK